MKTILGLLLLAASTAFAQPYPSKPIRVAVAFPPGGPVDIIARLLGPKLSEAFGGQSVVVENVVGAGGNMAATRVAKAPADGYTILAHSSAYAVNPTLIPNAGYDGEKDFVALAIVASQPNFIVVHADFPAKTLAELMARAKTDKLAFASAGNGTTPHLTGENLFKVRAKVDVTHIPFKGGGPAMMDVIAGNTQIAIGSLVQMLPQIKGGRLKALGVGSANRIPALPDLPTISETGVPGYEVTNWWGIVVPAGTPRPIVERLNRELTAVVTSAETKRRFETEGAEPLTMRPEEFSRFIAAETIKWGRVVKEAGIRAE